jgi:hypothetical protein
VLTQLWRDMALEIALDSLFAKLLLREPLGAVAMQRDPKSRAKYAALRSRGHNHARALRSDRLLNVACAMLRNGTIFSSPTRGDTARL